MTIKIFFISPFLNSWNVAAFPELIDNQRQKFDTKLVYCNAQKGRCFNNIYASKSICRQCSNNAQSFAKTHFPDLELIPVFPKEKDTPITFHEETKSILKYSAISTLNSRFRPVQNHWSTREHQFLEKLMIFGQDFLTAFSARLNAIKGQKTVIVFNGRVFPVSLARATKEQMSDVKFDSFEYHDNAEQIFYFKNFTVHDINHARDMLEEIAVNGLSKDQESLGHDFFSKSKESLKSLLGQDNFTEIQSSSRKTIVIFLSSDDELASLGEDWESPFTYDIIANVKRICEIFHDHEVIVRLHPNQVGQGKKILEIYKEIEGCFDHLQIIYPKDKVNSYLLINKSDFIVSFGSTISVEATYMGKVSILLGKQIYDRLDVVYVPNSFEELGQIIRSKTPVKPKSQYLSLVYGYFRNRPGINLKDTNIVDADAFYKGKRIIGKPALLYLIVKLIDHLRLRRADTSFKSVLRLILIKLNLYNLKSDRFE